MNESENNLIWEKVSQEEEESGFTKMLGDYCCTLLAAGGLITYENLRPGYIYPGHEIGYILNNDVFHAEIGIFLLVLLANRYILKEFMSRDNKDSK